MAELSGTDGKDQGQGQPSIFTLPLHLKREVTSTVDYEELDALPNIHPACSTYAAWALGWTRDEKRYAEYDEARDAARSTALESEHHVIAPSSTSRGLFSSAPTSAKLILDDIKAMLIASQVSGRSKISPAGDEKIRAWVRLFCTPELEKEPPRRRLVGDPELNGFYLRESLQFFQQARKEAIRAHMHASDFSIGFDFAAYYDQFRLLGRIPSYFSFEFEGEVYFQNTLCMGFRPACEVAQATTWLLVDFPFTSSTVVDTCIDNVQFSGTDRAGLVATAEEFVRRCARVGVVINDATISPADRVTQRFDFLGEHYDLVAKTRALTVKTVNKCRFVLAVLEGAGKKARWSRRRVAAFYGLAFFAAGVLDVELSFFYRAIAFYRKVAASDDWDSLAPSFGGDALFELRTWLQLCIDNVPVPLVKVTPTRPEYRIFTDASASRWGAVSVAASGTVRVFSERWKSSDDDVEDSTVAEPLAIRRAVTAVVSTGTRYIEVVTDHLGMVYANRARYAKGRQYNECIRELKLLFPLLVIKASFIPGAENIVPDKLSRGMLEQSAGRLMGDDLAWLESVKDRSFDLAGVEVGNLVAPVWMR